MKVAGRDVRAVLANPQVRRNALAFAFYAMLFLLLSSIASTYIVQSNPHLSAYDEDWDDISAFRADLKAMDIDTRSLVSSPVLLEEIDEPENTVFVVTGVEQDTISLPRFTNDESVIQFRESAGYSTTEIEAIVDFVARGGTILVMDDFGWGSGLASAFGLEYSGHRLYDAQSWARELDNSYIWANATDVYNYTDQDMRDLHPCFGDADGDGVPDRLDDDPVNPAMGGAVTSTTAGLCAHHMDANGDWNDSADYDLMFNSPSAFDKDAAELSTENRYALARSTQDSYLDTNDDGNLTVGFEGGGVESDEQGPFTTIVKVCEKRNCRSDPGVPMGRAIFVTDGSLLINAVYDAEGWNDGEYGGDADGALVPLNDNRRFALDLIAEALLWDVNASGMVAEDGITFQVIFDESRHQQPNPMGDTYNLLYYILVYFTNDWMAMLFLFLALFMAFEAVIIKKTDPEPWRHVFSINYYGFGDARRYGYYGRANKIKQVLLSRVRNLNSLTREEFDALPARELQAMINDDVLVRFVFEDRKYQLEHLVAVVKRVKMWGRR